MPTIDRSSPWRSPGRRLLVWIASGMLALAASGQTHAQNQARPSAISFSAVASMVNEGEIPVSAPALLDAFWAYLDEYEALLTRADADLVRVREQSRSEPGCFLNVRDATRSAEVEERAAKEHRVALDRLVERIAAAAPQAPAERMAKVRAVLACAAESTRFRMIAVPPDLGGSISAASARGWAVYMMDPDEAWMDAPNREQAAANAAAARQGAWAARCSNVERRLQAYQAFAKAVSEAQLVLAAKAEEFGVVGQSWDSAVKRQRELWMAMSADGADRNAIMEEVRREQERIQALANAMQGPGTPGGKIWSAVAREQAAAYLAVEAQLTAAQRAYLEGAWIPHVLGVWHPTDTQISKEEWSQTPRDLVRNLLRLKSLTDEQRAALRTKGRELVELDRAARHKALEAYASGATPDPEEMQHNEKILTAVADLGKAIGQPTLYSEEEGGVRFPKGDLLEALSAADTEEFGEVPNKDNTSARTRVAVARMMNVPVQPDLDYAATLCARLRVAPDMQDVVTVVVEDARERWAKEVEPRAKDSTPDYEREEIQKAEDPQAAWLKEVARAEDARAAAFAEANACQGALVDALAATLGPTVDAGALALLRAGVTAAIPNGFNRFGGMFAIEAPICLPLAVLEAPISEVSRAKVVAEIAPAAERWAQLAQQLQKGRLAAGRVQNERWMVEAGQAAADVRKRVEEADAQLARAEAAWATAEREGVERVAALLAPEEAEAWRAWIRRLRWPDLYPDLEPLARRVAVMLEGTPEDDSARTAVAAALARGRADIQRTGDAAAAIAASMKKPDQTGRWNTGMQESFQRVQPLRSVNTMRAAITAERVRLALPPVLAERATFGGALERMTAAAPAADSAER